MNKMVRPFIKLEAAPLSLLTMKPVLHHHGLRGCPSRKMLLDVKLRLPSWTIQMPSRERSDQTKTEIFGQKAKKNICRSQDETFKRKSPLLTIKHGGESIMLRVCLVVSGNGIN
ncbi:hypothetical protein AMECASPLE_009894 [Ameca splendens]|uniref:Uncharacterized protein n=1 Tax=Ameca splendens TaxID=208324 RepID=A0ABV1A9A2_9TELE